MFLRELDEVTGNGAGFDRGAHGDVNCTRASFRVGSGSELEDSALLSIHCR